MDFNTDIITFANNPAYKTRMYMKRLRLLSIFAIAAISLVTLFSCSDDDGEMVYIGDPQAEMDAIVAGLKGDPDISKFAEALDGLYVAPLSRDEFTIFAVKNDQLADTRGSNSDNVWRYIVLGRYTTSQLAEKGTLQTLTGETLKVTTDGSGNTFVNGVRLDQGLQISRSVVYVLPLTLPAATPDKETKIASIQNPDGKGWTFTYSAGGDLQTVVSSYTGKTYYFDRSAPGEKATGIYENSTLGTLLTSFAYTATTATITDETNAVSCTVKQYDNGKIKNIVDDSDIQTFKYDWSGNANSIVTSPKTRVELTSIPAYDYNYSTSPNFLRTIPAEWHLAATTGMIDGESDYTDPLFKFYSCTNNLTSVNYPTDGSVYALTIKYSFPKEAGANLYPSSFESTEGSATKTYALTYTTF